MKQRKEKVIIVIALIALVIVTVGISYAAFNYIGQGQKENTINTGNLTFVYDESNKEGNGISIENATPTPDSLGSVSKEVGNVFEFTVTASTKGAPIYYEIYATKQDSSTLPEKIIKTYLTEVQGEEETGVPNTLTNENINTYNKLGLSQVPDQENGKTLYQEMIPEGQDKYNKTFRYRMWISDTATEVDENGVWKYNDKSFTVKVNVYASNEEIGLPVAPPLPVMKTWTTNSTEDFHKEEYRTKITSAKFLDTVQVPENAIQSWDISAIENSGGIISWIEDDGMGSNTYSLTIAGEGGVQATNMEYFFQNFSSLQSIDFTNVDTSRVTNMTQMFFDCRSLESLNLSAFDTSNVRSMGAMFAGCSGLVSLDLSVFDTANVTYMRSMFKDCSKLINLNILSFDTSNVTDMVSMFYNCASLTELNLNHFNTFSVTNMTSMFSECYRLTSLNIDHFDTSNVTSMEYMFEDAQSLMELNLSSFNTSKVQSMYGMFRNCVKLVQLDFRNAKFLSNVSIYKMFYLVPSNITIIVRDTDAKTFIQNALGNGEGNIVIA